MSGSVLTTINDLLKKRLGGRKKATYGQDLDIKEPEIAAYMASQGLGFSPKWEMKPKVALKYKNHINGSENITILVGKWLSFHDRKWLNFKRPLTVT